MSALDRIEQRARAYLRDYKLWLQGPGAAPSQAHGHNVASDVLALVNIARAAQDAHDSISAITEDGFNLLGHEHVLALGGALAQLDGTAQDTA